MPSADSSRLIRPDHSTLRLEFNINRRPPEVSSTVFSERPADLQPVPLMEKDFAVHCQFDRHSMPHIRFLSIGPGFLLHASFRPRLTTTPLRFTLTSLHQVVKGTCTLKLLNMLGAQQKSPDRNDPGFKETRHDSF
jgi:hypothetical protein